ncbi:MAG: transcription antitermination factor NusB [Clostridia bacterium]|nr:transcription antitermination factor NusB [Clostridia bacterium]
MDSRRLARIAAMSLYYEREIKDSADEYSTTLVDFEDVLERAKLDDANLQYIDDALTSLEAHREDMDELISANLKDWTIERISKVDLSILRLAVAEMLYMKDIPVSVSVNEAVEISKLYSDREAYRFINGILRNISRTLEK